MTDSREATGSWLHAIGVACALFACVEAVVTFASPDQGRPRVLALSLALISAIVRLVGWSRFRLMGRVDAVVWIGVDAWVLADLGW